MTNDKEYIVAKVINDNGRFAFERLCTFSKAKPAMEFRADLTRNGVDNVQVLVLQIHHCYDPTEDCYY